MKNVRSKTTKKLFPILLTIALVLVSVITIYALESRGNIDLFKSKTVLENEQTGGIESTRPTNTVDYGPANPTDDVTVPDKDPNRTPIIPVNNELSITATSTRRNSAGNMYLIKAIVFGTNSGFCKATLSKGSKTFESNSSIALSEGQYSCTNLEVPMSSLDESGVWSLQLTVTETNGASASTSTEVIL